MSNILTRVGDHVSIPCLASDPRLDRLSLETCSGRPPAPGLRFTASLEGGIDIRDAQKAFEGCYVCTGRLGREGVRSRDYYLTVRPGKMELLWDQRLEALSWFMFWEV